MRIFGGAILGLLLAAQTAAGENRPNARNMYERVLALVPMVGAGTWSDPKRPMFVPAQSAARDRNGIIAWHFEPADDGKSALVEFVAVKKSALAPLISSKVPGVQVFEPAKHARKDIETALKAVKKDFDLEKFAARVQ